MTERCGNPDCGPNCTHGIGQMCGHDRCGNSRCEREGLRDKAREIAHARRGHLWCAKYPDTQSTGTHTDDCDDATGDILAGMRAALERVPRDGRAYYEIPKLLAELEEK